MVPDRAIVEFARHGAAPLALLATLALHLRGGLALGPFEVARRGNHGPEDSTDAGERSGRCAGGEDPDGRTSAGGPALARL